MSENPLLARMQEILRAVEAGEMPVPVAMSAARQAIDDLERSLMPAPKRDDALLGLRYQAAVPDDFPALAGKILQTEGFAEDGTMIECSVFDSGYLTGLRDFPVEWFGTVLTPTEEK